MLRYGSLVLSNTKAVIIVGLVIMLAVAALFISRQFTSASAGSDSGVQVIRSINTSASDTDSPATGVEFLNPVPDSNNSTQTSVTVNGQAIEVPQNGSVTQTIENDGNTATVNIQSENQSSSTGTGTNTNHSSVHVNVRSHSSSQGGSL
jgi:hypothetical protein